MSEKDKASIESQGKRFIETAKTIGCDEDEAAFKARLGKLLSAPIKKEPAAPAKPKKPKPSK